MGEARASRISGQPPDAPVRDAPVVQRLAVEEVLDLVEQLLHERGWCQGRTVDRAGRLSLDGAVDEAAARIARSERARLALAGRVRNQLCRSAGAASLSAWNDVPARRLAEIGDLIRTARFRGI